MSDWSRGKQLFREGAWEELRELAAAVTRRRFGRTVVLRGLIEYSNRCRCNCLYCGIRREAKSVKRYTLSTEQILACAEAGFRRGLRTFVLQGGEDSGACVDRLAGAVAGIKALTGDEAAVTLSAGVMEREAYGELRRAGADRYLIRFETADPRLHLNLRDGISLERRLRAIEDLRGLGYQIGSGFMTGLPGESREAVIENAALCRSLRLDMAGIGPFIPHPDTPLADAEQHPLEEALAATALLRLALPAAWIPATTAAGSLAPDGRERMIRHGANVVMPNLTPVEAKRDYQLYPGKICLDEDGLHCIGCIGMRVRSVGGELSFARADGLAFTGGAA